MAVWNVEWAFFPYVFERARYGSPWVFSERSGELGRRDLGFWVIRERFSPVDPEPTVRFVRAWNKLAIEHLATFEDPHPFGSCMTRARSDYEMGWVWYSSVDALKPSSRMGLDGNNGASAAYWKRNRPNVNLHQPYNFHWLRYSAGCGPGFVRYRRWRTAMRASLETRLSIWPFIEDGDQILVHTPNPYRNSLQFVKEGEFLL